MPQHALTVLQVLPALQSGGVERGTLEVAAELVRQGHRSLVISAGGRMQTELVEQGSEHITLPIGKKSLTTLGLIPTLRRILVEQEIDILHARSRLPAWIAWRAWRKLAGNTNPPHFVTTFHGFYSPGWYSSVMARGERVIAVSDSIHDYIRQHYARTPEPALHTIYRGVDPQHYPLGYQPSQQWLDRWAAEYPSLQNKFIVTLPGRITRLKGCEDLIEILALLKQKNVETHALVVGDVQAGKQAFLQELQDKARHAGVDNITFCGHRADVQEIMAVSNIVLSLSNKPESFGRTTLEALTMGVPVLGYDHGGVGEQLATLLPPGRIAVGDINAAANTIEAWMTQAPVVKRNEVYTLDKMLEQTLALYRDVVGI
ncbi:MAG TPA: glycosyltransferase [Chromatiales bacterium]|nr:glycosyltransferase [Chromatiales bacterium]